MSNIVDQERSAYPIGQSPEEMRRLKMQADVLHTEPTHLLFLQAGITQSMRVLDIGCGAGDASFLAAEFVGPSGEVIGLDSSPVALETARARASHFGITNVSFIAEDLSKPLDHAALAASGPFDALVGRAVLMYLPDPAATIRSFLPLMRPGGVVAFREPLIGEPFLEAVPSCPLIDRYNAWYMSEQLKVYEALKLNGQTGIRLHQVFQDAGLPAPQCWLHAPIGHAPDWPGWEYLSNHVQMLMNLAIKVGVSIPSELDPTTFGDRVRQQVLEQRGILRIQRGVQAWARLPNV